MRGDLKGQRSKVKVITSRHQFDACLPVTRQRKVADAPKLAPRLSMPRVTFRIASRVKRSKVKVIGRSGWLYKGAEAYFGGRTTGRTACYAPAHNRRGHYAMLVSVCLSVFIYFICSKKVHIFCKSLNARQKLDSKM